MEKSLQDPRAFLVIQTSFIGDAILASAVVEKLITYYPDTSIDILVRKGNESLYEHHPHIRKCYVWNKKKKYKSLFNTIKTIRKQRYDAVINLHRFASSGLVTWLAKSDYKVGFSKNPLSFAYHKKYNHVIGDGTHETERNHLLIRSFTDEQPSRPKLYASEEQQEKIKKTARKPYVCIAPKSVWKTKELPYDKWLELEQQLDSSLHIYLIGGPDDRSYCEKLQQDMQRDSIEVRCGQDSLLEAMVLMQGATMNYVNDSAPAHLASAGNAPITIFYCSTIPAFGFTPVSDQTTIVETRENLSCRPCGLHGKKECPEGHFKCGHTITIP